MKVVFLDIDGVLNKVEKHPCADSTDPNEKITIPIAFDCLARLNRLIADTGAKIVISTKT